MQSYVNGFMFTPNGSFVALVRKNRPEWQAGLLNGIGGKIEPGETPREAMYREFQEETGVGYVDWEPLVCLHCPGVYEVYFFVAFTASIKNISTQTDEPIECWFVPRLNCDAHAKSMTVKNLRWLIPLAQDKTVKHGSFIDIEDTTVTEDDRQKIQRRIREA